MLIDTHCHVHFNAFKDDMDEVIKRTLAQGVFMITVGTQKDTSQKALAVANQYDGVWASVGLHPNHLCEQEFFDDDELPSASIKTRCEQYDHDFYYALAQQSKCVAIGEVGLDYYHLPKNANQAELKNDQKMVCCKFFELADESNLPVIIHSRDAFLDQYALIKEFVDAGGLKRRGVVHCFSGTIEEAQAYLDLGFMVSFTGMITFKPKKGMGEFSPIQAVVKAVPLESIMVETDAPYLAPEPHRGQRSEPWMVRFTAEKIAELKGVSIEEVSKITGENAKRMFGVGVDR
ncbi:TatD family hydrolase [Patescibacteria group bacterium]|nr:TatD family hydrolase [Patescibacteria group bacterium]MBU1705342.1 TatD family hydrolase [Patescibacteria group bacterium]